MRGALAAVLIAGGLLVAAVPRYLLPTCELAGFGPMHCSDAARLWLGIGVALAAAGAAALLVPSRMIAAPAAAGTLLAVGAIAVPAYTGFCASPRMPCHYGTVPAMRFIGGALAVASVAMLGALLVRRGKGTP